MIIGNMKRNIYSYSKLWMILFVLMGAACTNQVEDAIPVSGQPIEFSVQSDWKEIPNTRLNDGKMNFVAKDTIQIFGFHKSSSGGVQKFMYRVNDGARGQKVVYDGKDWNYSPKRFWPKEGTLDFYVGYPEYSVLYKEDKMTYEQTTNPLQLDLLSGVSAGHKCAKDLNPKVEVTMVHALAKVNIILDNKSWGEIGTVIVSAYKAGSFTQTDGDGIPKWDVPDVEENKIAAVFGYNDLIRNNSGTSVTVTVFILPGKITGFQMFGVPHGNENAKRIDASDKIFDGIKNLKFDAGKEYNLNISSKGVQKNTNSRSIAMSVRCVSE